MQMWRGTGLLCFVSLGLLGISGCFSTQPKSQAPAKPFQGASITIGAVGDPAILKTVETLRGEWEVSQAAKVTIRNEPVDPKATQGVDVLLLPGDRLGDLVDQRALLILPETIVQPPARTATEESTAGPTAEPAADPLQFSDVAPAFRDLVTRYGDDRTKRVGLPYGGTALVLVYRREGMERPENQAAAKEKGLALEPPSTWEQLDDLARFFHGRDWDGDGKNDSGIALAWGDDPEGLGESTFLARAAALGQHRDQYSFLFDSDTMEPRITTPPFVEALRALFSLRDSGPDGAGAFDAERARAAFRSGTVALLIDRAERAASWTDPKSPIKVGVAALPGSERMYDPERKAWETASPVNRPSYLPRGGGWIASVCASSSGRNREAGIDFIKYLTNPESAGRIRVDRELPMLPVRTAQMNQGLPDPRTVRGIDARQWSRAVTQTLLAPRVIPGLRIPEAEGYLADLRKARVTATGAKAAVQALQAAADAWNARTERLGRERQLWHYRRSLNSLATSPEPPPH